MTDAEKKAVEAKMTIGDFLQFDPPALSATNFKPEILVGDLRFKGYLNGFPRLGVERSEAEYREDERRAAAAVRHAETKMINDIRGNPAELNARVKFLEETNGIKLSILNEKQR
ncbi:MAG: hypothetical protein LBO78_03665 [Rickettsiales bacterium]|nr:hypothetical protein [Rickettsiales bacterium]